MKSNWKIGLSGNMLKIIAMLSMLIDHAGLYLFNDNIILRTIGRISFPIFAYMIAEGCAYTRNRARHLGMIAGLGILCQAVATVAVGGWYMNILITFSLAIATIYSIDTLLKRETALRCSLAVLVLCGVGFLTFILPLLLRGFTLDYGAFGVFLPVLLYYTKGRFQRAIGMAVLLIAMSFVSIHSTQWVSLVAVLLLSLYNGKRGKANLKYLFYVFYPVHLVILFLIAEFFCH